MIVVTIASEALLAKLDLNRQRLAKLADPRMIGMNDAEADKLVADSVPIYYITGTIHSPETGAPSPFSEFRFNETVPQWTLVLCVRSGSWDARYLKTIAIRSTPLPPIRIGRL